MMDEEYCRARAAEERAKAENATDRCVELVHIDMADRYEQMVHGSTNGLQIVPERLDSRSQRRRQ